MSGRLTTYTMCAILRRAGLLAVLSTGTGLPASAEPIIVTGFLEINDYSDAGRNALHFTGPRFEWINTAFTGATYTTLGIRRQFLVPVPIRPSFVPEPVSTFTADDTHDGLKLSRLFIDGIQRDCCQEMNDTWHMSLWADGPDINPPNIDTDDVIEFTYPMTLRLVIAGPLTCCPTRDHIVLRFTVPATGQMKFHKAPPLGANLIYYRQTYLRIDVLPEPVPEPASWLLLGGGMAALLTYRRRYLTNPGEPREG